MSPSSHEPRSTLGPGPRTKVRRLPERGRYDSETVHAILDEGWVCHLAVSSEDRATILPTVYARSGDVLYMHGAPANNALRSAEVASEACVTVTLVDAIVVARSAFHHSVNYRCVVMYGPASQVTDPEEKEAALLAIVEHVLPGRAGDTRPPSPEELRATRVTKFVIAEASAKVRMGGPNDDPEDLGLEGVWAGQLPLNVVPGPPIAEMGVLAPVPAYVDGYGRRR